MSMNIDPSMIQKLFNQVDKNGDGKVSAKELQDSDYASIFSNVQGNGTIDMAKFSNTVMANKDLVAALLGNGDQNNTAQKSTNNGNKAGSIFGNNNTTQNKDQQDWVNKANFDFMNFNG